jgi:hypothetical protein
MELITLALAIAAVIHIWLAGSLFQPLRTWVAKLRQSKHWFLRTPAIGALCHFCISCQLALGYGLWTGNLMTALAAILPANAVIVVFIMLANAQQRR